jgi:hypothetical protein
MTFIVNPSHRLPLVRQAAAVGAGNLFEFSGGALYQPTNEFFVKMSYPFRNSL